MKHKPLKRKHEKLKNGKNYRVNQGRMYFVSLFYGLICFAIIFVLIASNITPKKYNLNAGDIAPETIYSTKLQEDTLTTNALRDEAASRVSTVFNKNKDVSDRVVIKIDEAYSQLQKIAQKGEEERQKMFQASGVVPEGGITYSDAFVVNMVAQMPVESTKTITIDILNMAQSDIAAVGAAVKEKTVSTMDAGVTQQYITTQKNYIVAEISRQYAGISGTMMELTTKILNKYFEPNLLADNEETIRQKDNARNSVEPIVYKKGQYIVQKGETITAVQIQVIKDLGLLSDHSIDLSLYLGAGTIIFILLALIATYAFLYERELLQHPSKILMLCIILVLVVALSLVSKSINPMLIQVTLGTILIAMLLHTRMALITNVSMSIITGMIISDESGVFSINAITATIISIIVGTVAVYMCLKPMHRMRILLTGLVIGFVGVIASIALGLIFSGSLLETFYSSLWVLAGGLISAVFCIGTLPIWETVFRLLTPTKLLEITNPNQPLLRRLALEAPGTYHHSIIVANVAEAAAESIGANALLVRAGAYYHDVGKLRLPECYTENQNETNKAFHSFLSPEDSADAIRTHTTEGMELGQKQKLPAEIIDIIGQHHGTNPIFYFYAKALEQNPSAEMENYSYPGPKPQSKEAAIIMLADSVEAAIRSHPNITPQTIEEQVDKIIGDRLNMGQLDDCNLTFRQVKTIKAAFIQVLSGVYHKRIEYPDIDKEKLKPRRPNETEGGAQT